MTYMQSNLAFAAGIQELSFDEIGFVSGGSVDAPPGSPLLGINAYIPDCLENTYYQRMAGGGLWFSYLGNGLYSAWDENGDRVGTWASTTSDKAQATVTTSSGMIATLGGLLGGSEGTVYLKDITRF
jgi:hypothetical protein